MSGLTRSRLPSERNKQRLRVKRTPPRALSDVNSVPEDSGMEEIIATQVGSVISPEEKMSTDHAPLLSINPGSSTSQRTQSVPPQTISTATTPKSQTRPHKPGISRTPWK